MTTVTVDMKNEDVATVMEDDLISQTDFDGPSATFSEDITTEDVMRAVEASGVLDFWLDPEEDGYTHDDGDPA